MTALDDAKRLKALADTRLLDGEPDEAFDRLTRVAAALLDVPVSLVSFVDPGRQFFVSCLGLGEPWRSARETPLSHSFCQHCVVAAAPFVVDDARLHPLVRDSPAIDELGVVAYAGVPITSADGSVLGTLCAIDSKPRAWTEEDVALLSDLAAAAVSELERRTLVQQLSTQGLRPTEPAADDEPGLSVEAVARRTQIPAATLRKWEQRYGMPRPGRTSGRHRRYTERDVQRIEWLKARLAEGYRVSEAAERLAIPAEEAPVDPSAFVDDVCAAALAGDSEGLERALVEGYALAPDPLRQIVRPALLRLAEGCADGEPARDVSSGRGRRAS